MSSNDDPQLLVPPYLDAIEPEAVEALPLDDPNRAVDEGVTIDHEQHMGELLDDDQLADDDGEVDDDETGAA